MFYSKYLPALAIFQRDASSVKSIHHHDVAQIDQMPSIGAKDHWWAQYLVNTADGVGVSK